MSFIARVLTDTEDNIRKYTDFIAAHPKGHVLQAWEWGEVKAGTGWQPIRIVVEDSSRPETPIVAAVSLLKRQLPAGLGSIFYSPRGPVIDMSEAEVWQTLRQAVKAEAARHKAVFWKVDPDIDRDFPEAEIWRRALAEAGFRSVDKGEGFEGVQPRFVFRLDIRDDIETLLAACHQKTRYNIRLAGKKGVEIVAEASREALPEFYNILVTTATRDRFLIRPYRYFEAIYDHLHPVGQAELFMAYHEGEAIAGTLALHLGEKTWYLYGASSNSKRNLMPNYKIQWTMIEWAKEHGSTLYDFRGVPGDVGEDHPLFGLVKFKRGFGGKYTEFIGEYDLVYKPFNYHLYNFLEPLYQKWVRKLIGLKKKLKGGK